MTPSVLRYVVLNIKLCLHSKYRKNILRFLDAERDVSVVKSSFKPGDVIHYVLDRRRTLNISHDLHSLLPEVSPMKNRRFKTCAVVGNSGILLDSECGKEIDSHNFVIRWASFCFCLFETVNMSTTLYLEYCKKCLRFILTLGIIDNSTIFVWYPLQGCIQTTFYFGLEI